MICYQHQNAAKHTLFKSSIKVVFLSVKLQYGSFEGDRYHFSISIINKKKSNFISLYSDIPCDDDYGAFNDDDDNDEVDRTEQVFNFVNAPSFVSLFSGSPNEPLYFVNVTEERSASGNKGKVLFKVNKVLFKVGSIKKC